MVIHRGAYKDNAEGHFDAVGDILNLSCKELNSHLALESTQLGVRA